MIEAKFFTVGTYLYKYNLTVLFVSPSKIAHEKFYIYCPPLLLNEIYAHGYRERIESHFQLNDSRRMWQGQKTICSSGNKSSAEVRADSLLAEELNTFYGRFECNGDSATLQLNASGSSRQSSDDHVITASEDEVRRELKRVKESQESSRTWWDYWPCSEVLCWSACWFVYFNL